ncbi:MAG: hypothetical protein Q7J68_05020 [Thermoplasmata archaeon]|nr:hypothetical protein [Thermoplasmata archaeon]
MKTIWTAISATIIIAMILAMGSNIGAPNTALETSLENGTRTGEIGWQYETFSQNLGVSVTPQEITTLDQIIVTVSSKLPQVFIKQATMYGVVYPNDGIQFPFSFPFLKLDDITFQCVIEPFPLNGYDIEFYLVVYDYFFTPMDSRNSEVFSYSVVGSGWRHDTFDENVILTYWPMRANASEEVSIILISKENVTISGANLYVTYVTPEGDAREGGWNFSKTNVNSTELKRSIPGYPAGTNITFWVTAWDQYNSVVTSRMYNYSVMGISEYTDFPFEYTDAGGDRSQWIPDDAIILPMAGMCALAIPLFIYLYAVNLKRRKRAMELVSSKKAAAEPEEVKPDE